MTRKEKLAKAIEIMAREGAMTLPDLYAKVEGVTNPTLRQSLRYQSPEWAAQYIRKSSLYCDIGLAIESAFEAGTLLACQAMERGKLDATYGALWTQLMTEATQDFDG